MGYNRQKDKNGYRSSSKGNGDDGTSARTRPLSFDDIMLRRKSKVEELDIKNNFVGAESVSRKEDRHKRTTDGLEPEQNRYDESLPSASRHTSEDSRKLASRQTENNMMAEKLARGKHKDSRESEIKSKTSVNKDLSNKRLADIKTDKDYLVRRRKDEEFVDDSRNETGKRHSRDLARKERSTDKTDRRRDEGRKVKDPDKDERQSYRKRKDMEVPSDAPLDEAEKRHSRNHGRRDSYADKTEIKSESGRRKHRSDDEERNRDKNADKKHSSSKVSEVTGRVESSRAQLEEERPKRRRSRSREYDKDRGRRSRSGSPRGRKHSSHDHRERGEFSSHSSKDKSGRSHYDLDKKISSNGSDSHSKRHAESTSGLGGYSPRKRKSEAAAKTPPPTNRSPDRKNAGWDLPPGSAGSDVTGSVPSSVQSSMQSVIPNIHQLSSVVPANTFTTKTVGVSYNYLFSSIHATDSVQLTQATRPMRRLYLENLPNSASEKDILDWISHSLLSSGVNRIQGTQPCISCMIHKEKRQALLEFLTPEDASAALSFDGRSFCGSILKIRRPKDFVEVATGVPQKSVAAADRIDNTVEDSPYKIFVGGISRTISSEMLMEIAKAFGPLKAYHFSMNSDINEPCAFLEYVDHSVTLKACAGLNGMKLGGKVLTVVQAVPDTVLLDKDGNTPLYRIPQHAKPLLDKPTEVLKLKNLVDANVLFFLSEAEVEEFLEDIRLECARFGTVKSINVVKQSQCSLTSDPAAMDTSPTLDEDDMEFAKECDRNDPSPESSDHELEVGGSHLPNSDEEPMETNSAEEAERCADGKTRMSEPLKGDSEEEAGDVDDALAADGKTQMSEPLKGDSKEEAGDADDALAGGSHSNDGPHEEVIKDDTSDPLPNDGNVSDRGTSCQENSEVTRGVSPNEKNTTIVLERKDEDSNSSPVEHLELNDQSPVKEGMKSEEDNGNVDGAFEPEFSSKEELDAREKLEEKTEISVNDVFEPGFVLVEFRRAEAACMAAHCLHGRLFDDRTVTVEYVPLDLYRTKFSKQN